MKLSEILIPDGYDRANYRCIKSYHVLLSTGLFGRKGDERNDAERVLLKLLPDLYKIRNIGRVFKYTIINKLSESLIENNPIGI